VAKQVTKITLSSKDAKEAIHLCLSNAETFLDDAELLIAQKRVSNVVVPIQIALEEIGKSRIILDKIMDQDDMVDDVKIELSTQDGIFNHKAKLQAALSLVSLPFEESSDLDERFNAKSCPQIGNYVWELKMAEEKELRQRAKQGHYSRLDSCYVDFDNSSGKAVLEKPKFDYTFPLLIQSLRWAIRWLDIRTVRAMG
jgi:AbiV family abortive infection protein